jgi:peptidoglycan/LPS O-acetylase OafA/YrhL
MWYHFTAFRPQASLGFTYGLTGVDLFFMISGFVIFMSLSHVKSSLQFIVNRVSRLYPTYWACVTITFLSITLYNHIDFNQTEITTYLGNLTMFQFYLNMRDVDDSYWTLIIEMTFYIAMLFLFHFKKLHYLNTIAVILMSIVSILGMFFFNFEAVKTALNTFQLLQYIPLFLAGITFYKLYYQKEKVIQNYGVLIACLICQILSYYYSNRFNGAISITEYFVILIIYFGLFTAAIHHKLKFMINPVTLHLGKISFALYLLHQAIGTQILIPYFMNDLQFGFWTASLLLAMPIIIFVATLVTYFIEIPLGRFMKQRLFSNKLKTA